MSNVSPVSQPDTESAAPFPAAPAAIDQRHAYRLSPLIRLTLLLLYITLTLPLPFLAEATQAPVSPMILAIGLAIGFIVLYGALSERVILDKEGIGVTYSKWMSTIFRRGWWLSWSEIKALKPRTTGQGGIVYYFVSTSGKAYLLPMRVAGFADLVRRVQVQTSIDMTDVKPLAQPWMYFILLTFTLLLLAIDGWTIRTAMGQGLGTGI